jgi:predicted N-acetyltransferase YhbS
VTTQSNIRPCWQPRHARLDDVPALEALIPVSARELQAAHYSAAQIEAALGPVFAVDRQLIIDRTYFVVEREGTIIGCGGWSKRATPYGAEPSASPPELDPAKDAARIRAFFVDPAWARRGVGHAIMCECERALTTARFKRAEIVATLSGEPLYAGFGYAVKERFLIPLPGGLSLPAVRMFKAMPGDTAASAS